MMRRISTRETGWWWVDEPKKSQSFPSIPKPLNESLHPPFGSETNNRQALVTHKIAPESLKLLRHIAAETGERQYAALARILAAEWEHIREEITNDPA